MPCRTRRIPEGPPSRVPTWEEIARDHGRFLYTVAYRLTGNHDDAQDLVQEVLLRVRRGLATYQPGSLEGWLSRITTNAFLDEVRRRKRRPLEVVPELPEPALGVDADPDEVAGPEPAARGRPGRHPGACPSDFRAAVVLCDVVGLDYAEIADSPRRSRRAPSAAASTAAGPSCARRWPRDRRPSTLTSVLSAYLDGELAPGELASVQAHLDDCAGCRAEFEAEREVRDIVRGLPPVDPPFGFYERLLRSGLDDTGTAAAPFATAAGKPKRRFKFGLANLVATAAVWLLILGLANVNSGHGAVSPSVNNYVTAHASLVPGFGRDGGGVSADAAHEAQSHNVPDRLAGTYELVGVQDEGGTPQLVYSNGDMTLSMFLRPGELDASDLPASAEQVLVNGAPAWSVPTAGGDVVFVQRPGIVVVIVGQVPTDATSQVATQRADAAGRDRRRSGIGSSRRGGRCSQAFGLRG